MTTLETFHREPRNAIKVSGEASCARSQWKERPEKFSRKLIFFSFWFFGDAGRCMWRWHLRLKQSHRFFVSFFVSDLVGSLMMYLHFLTPFSNKIASQSRWKFRMWQSFGSVWEQTFEIVNLDIFILINLITKYFIIQLAEIFCNFPDTFDSPFHQLTSSQKFPAFITLMLTSVSVDPCLNAISLPLPLYWHLAHKIYTLMPSCAFL